MKKSLSILSLALTVALTACINQKPPAPRKAYNPTLTYVCGSKSIGFKPVKDKATLYIGGEPYAMKKVASAPGAKYESVDDPTTMFWHNDYSALITLHGLDLPSCTKKR